MWVGRVIHTLLVEVDWVMGGCENHRVMIRAEIRLDGEFEVRSSWS